MPDQTASLDRRAQFKVALIHARLNVRQWAALAGVSVTHLNAVLNGDRESTPLNARIDAFLAEHAPKPEPAAA